MKIILLAIFFFLSIEPVAAQYKSGVVIYKSSSIFDLNGLDTPPQFKQTAKQIISIVNTLEFTIKFNRQEALYTLNENLAIDTHEHLNNMAILVTRGDRLVYSNPTENLLIEKTESFGKTFLIKSQLDFIEWNLTTETKEIEGYTCYKATALLINKGGPKNEDRLFDLTAWYAPELSFNFGLMKARAYLAWY